MVLLKKDFFGKNEVLKLLNNEHFNSIFYSNFQIEKIGFSVPPLFEMIF